MTPQATSFWAKIFCLIVVFMLWAIPPIYAQNFEHIPIEQGFAQRSVVCIFQDSRGFLWFGTKNGLSRYDGYTFVMFRHDPDNPQSLSHNHVTSIYEDASGDLWIATNGGGLNQFDRNQEIFRRYQTNPEHPQSLTDNRVFTVHGDPSGKLWIGTLRGLNALVPGQQDFLLYQADPNDPYSFHNRVFVFYEDRSGQFWLGTQAGLKRFDPETGQFTPYQTDPVYAIYEDRFRRFWIGASTGLKQFDWETGKFRHYHSDMVSAIYEDRLGILWFGTSGGLKKFSPQTGQFLPSPKDADNLLNTLSENNVMALYADRSGVLWIGSQIGIKKITSETEQFLHYQHDPDNPESLSDDEVTAVYQDRAGVVWIGTASGVLNKLEPASGVFRHYQVDPVDPYSQAKMRVTAIYEDHTGIMWIGTQGESSGKRAGLKTFDRTTEQFTPYHTDPNNPHSLSSNNVTAIYEDRAGILWVGTFGGGPNRFDRDTQQFSHFQHDPNDPNSLSNDTISAIYEDPSGVLWIGTFGGGLDRFDPSTSSGQAQATQTFTHFQQSADDPYSLSYNWVNAIYEDRSGTLWISTGNGLNKFDRANAVFTRYTQKDGLPYNAVYGILEDAQGKIWLSTPNGLSRFHPSTEQFWNYAKDDGLPITRFSPGAYYQNSNGEMLFGGVNGFIRFAPAHNAQVPLMALTDFQILNKSVSVGADSVLKKAVTEVEAITLSYKARVFSFEFAALDFTNPEKNRYAYMKALIVSGSRPAHGGSPPTRTCRPASIFSEPKAQTMMASGMKPGCQSISLLPHLSGKPGGFGVFWC